MFGIIRPCRHRLSPGLHADWLAHLCGHCLALRDEHGQLARLVTNYDGLVISALVEAQSPRASRRTAGPCPLRGMRRASVADGAGARLAATVSLVLASVKLRDHADDGDGALQRAPLAALARTTAARWETQGTVSGERIGFDTTVLTGAVEGHGALEQHLASGDSVLLATEPTERATGEAFAHTAVLTRSSDNAAPLAEAGRLFGRAAHLLDAVEDLEVDTASGAWNPLTATGTDLSQAREVCDDAVHGVRLALREADLTDSRLVHALLVHELRQAVQRTFGHASTPRASSQPQDGDGGACWVPKLRVPPQRRGPLLGCLAATYMCCSCQFCCRDPHPGPWSGQPRGTCCDGVCTGWECCSCCGTCECCDC